MLDPRVLVVLSEIEDGEALLRVALDAVARAARPNALRFALPARHFDAVLALHAGLPEGALSADDLRFYDDVSGLAGVAPLLTDETHVLSLKGRHAFSEGWDAALISRYASVGGKRALMTGWIEPPADGAGAQAFLPAFDGELRDGSARVRAGVALVCSEAPVETRAVAPALLFARTDFLFNMELADDTLSIAAFVAGYAVFALDRPVLWPVSAPRERPLSPPAPERLPSTVLERFEQLAGLSFQEGRVSPHARLGLFFPGDGYPQRVSRRFALEQRVEWLWQLGAPPSALFVTAFCDLDDRERPAALYVQAFQWLRALERVHLLLYTGGEMERRLRASHPNSLAYPDNALLPRALLGERMTPTLLFKRNKLLLLKRASESHPDYEHLVWVDMDSLAHPVWAEATLRLSHLTDERVHLAVVRDTPDASLLVVPRGLLPLLGREVRAITQMDEALGRSYAESTLWSRLIDKFPDLFTLHPMPQSHLLLLTCLDPSLLSQRERALLKGLPPPICPPAPTPSRMKGRYRLCKIKRRVP